MIASLCVMACSASEPANVKGLPVGDVLVEHACFRQDWVAELPRVGTSLFWISECDGGSLRRASTIDGTVDVVRAAEPYPEMLNADDAFLYWARVPPASDGGEIVRLPVAGDISPQVIATMQQHMESALVQQLTVDDTHVYRSTISSILAVPKDGTTPPQTIVDNQCCAFLAADETHLYWRSAGIFRRQKDSALVEQLASSAAVIFDPIALTSTAAYYWQGEGGLVRIDKTTGVVDRITTAQGHPLNRVFVSDGSYVYWIRDDVLVRTSDDGVIDQIAWIGPANVYAVAVDDQYVYWVSDDRIYRAAKAP